MARTLNDKVLEALQGRSVWEERQRLWYEMRHQGIPRRNKPFRNAADLHLPIGDNAVEKLKPYYINSIFGRNRLASFTSLRQEQGDANAAAADYLDWQLRNGTNYQLECAYIVDLMAVAGVPVMKVRWDPEINGRRGGVVFEAVDPLCFVVPTKGDVIDEMDWFCHIRCITVAKFLRDKRYQASNDLLGRIRGGQAQEEHWKGQEKANREGLTWSKDEDDIILFEAYERVQAGWHVRTYSPSSPGDVVRPDFTLPYRWRGEAMQPFVRWRMEITEKGFYAPRGVVEKTAPFETYGTKMWNAQADWLDFASRPLFTTEPGTVLPNTANVRMRPGEVLPPGVKPGAIPEPPFSIEEQINNCRQLAEESAGTPDFGVTQDAKPGEKGGDNRTATEWNYLGSFASQGIQYKAWVSGQAEGETYRKAWALYVMYGKNALTYYQATERKVLPAQALHDEYLIQPDAAPDSWDKGRRMQRSLARFQTYKGHPNINQEELVKSCLEDDDPRLVKRLFVSSGNKAANEREDEGFEILLLLQGFQAAAMPGENHVLRLQTLFGKLQQESMKPPPTTREGLVQQAIGIKRMHEHIMQHMMLLKQENPAAFRQFSQAMSAADPGSEQQVAQPQQTRTISAGGAVPPVDGGTSSGLMGAGPSGVGGRPALVGAPA